MYLFDLDGTLIDSTGIWHQIDLDFLERHNFPWSKEYEAGVVTAIFPKAAAFTKAFFGMSETPEEIMAEWMEMAHEEYAEKIPLKPHVKEFLDQCSAEGAVLAIYTSSEPVLCYAALDHLGIRHYFSQVLFARDMGEDKHTPASYRRVQERLDASPSDIHFFDDSPLACAGAVAAGWDVTGVYDENMSGTWESFQNHAHRCIRDFSELLHSRSER